MRLLNTSLACLIIISIFFLACNRSDKTENRNSFKITGNVKGIQDSAVVILKTNTIVFDSALVIKGEFELQGSLKEPVSALLLVPTTDDYKIFWIENSDITFSAEKNKFESAKITGSKTQVENDKLLVKESLLIIKRDSLENLLYSGKPNLEKEVIKKELKKLQQDLKKEYISLVKSNPASYVSANILNIFKTTWGKETVQPIYQTFNEKIKNSSYGQSIKSYLELNVNPKIGDRFIDFESKDINGKTVKLSEIKSKAVLLDFWAAWCFPCRKENKNLVKVYKDYKKYGFEILGVSGDAKREPWIEAVKEDKLIWTNVFDEKGTDSKPFLIYGINGIPDNFLINSEGVIVARNLRGDELRKKLDELLK